MIDNLKITKKCSKCNIEKSNDSFRKDITKKDGLRPECKSCVKEFERKKRQSQPDLMSSKLHYFYEKNPHKRKEYRENYKNRKHEQRKERRKKDPIFAITNNLRCRIYKFLNRFNTRKNSKTFEIVGCTPQELKKHIEEKFIDGMSWENRNEWHIDHIIPLSSAKSINEVYDLCHYTNLQPLWATENIKKGNKIL